jgi:predicted DNA-binding transcriptional regulator YafY
MELNSEFSERILEAFDTFNALNISERLAEIIHFEKRKPLGTENLYGLLHAIKNQLQIRFKYQKFWEEGVSIRLVEPYALKEFRYRWYLMAFDPKDKLVKSFALDRLSDLEITNKKNQFPQYFDIHKHYQYSFGVISPEKAIPEVVILSLDPFQGKYIKSLPLHSSQEILIDNEHECRIQLKLHITHDFFMEICSLGNKVKVIQPESFRQQIIVNAQEVLKLY